MKRIHIAISTNNIDATIKDYTTRLGITPCAVVNGEYALWRTDTINLSIRQDVSCKPGELRHLGWEDPSIVEFAKEVDVNGIVWERFTAEQQADEINDIWPGTRYVPK